MTMITKPRGKLQDLVISGRRTIGRYAEISLVRRKNQAHKVKPWGQTRGDRRFIFTGVTGAWHMSLMPVHPGINPTFLLEYPPPFSSSYLPV